jgi:hypothetical protein
MNEVANDPDRFSESPSFLVERQREGNENISVGIPASRDDAPTVNGSALSIAPTSNQNDPFVEQVNSVINSEACLSRLVILCLYADQVLLDWGTDPSYSAEAKYRLCKSKGVANSQNRIVHMVEAKLTKYMSIGVCFFFEEEIHVRGGACKWLAKNL